MFTVEEPMLHLFLACQGFVVLFIALHDWIPLGSLNNLSGIRAADSMPKLLVVTVLSTLPFAVAFAASVYYSRSGFPMWVMWWRNGIRPDALHVCFHVVMVVLLVSLSFLTFS